MGGGYVAEVNKEVWLHVPCWSCEVGLSAQYSTAVGNFSRIIKIVLYLTLVCLATSDLKVKNCVQENLFPNYIISQWLRCRCRVQILPRGLSLVYPLHHLFIKSLYNFLLGCSLPDSIRVFQPTQELGGPAFRNWICEQLWTACSARLVPFNSGPVVA